MTKTKLKMSPGSEGASYHYRLPFAGKHFSIWMSFVFLADLKQLGPE